MNLPENLKYSKDHEWMLIDNNIATVGITDFAQKELGDIVFFEVDTLDEDLQENEVIGTIEAVKTVSDIFSPIAGKVIEVNEKIETDPELVNSDPYGEGWLVKIEIEEGAATEHLLDSNGYKALVTP